jgi:hypothetical protein
VLVYVVIIFAILFGATAMLLCGGVCILYYRRKTGRKYRVRYYNYMPTAVVECTLYQVLQSVLYSIQCHHIYILSITGLTPRSSKRG